MEPTTKRHFKDSIYEQFARIGRALANPHRLELLDLLAQGERTVEELARETSMSVANASQHLQTLRAAHLVSVRREGTYAFYQLSDHSVFDLWRALRTVGEGHLAEIDQLVNTYLHNRAELQPMPLAELYRQLEEGDVVVVDVRPVAEYHAGHIPQARSIPIDELDARLHELPQAHTIVAYCRGPYCVFADEALELLRDHGFHAYRLAEGLPEWRAQGYPVLVESGGVTRAGDA
jgi:rhodanese-related sulfurtransferase